tara:strand:- start:38 stop:238 length:201 start_codon:yes stop_codon:yes gene_type:complete
MTILNYFFIGFAFTFLIDILMGLNKIKNHPKMKNHKWEWNERIMCIVIWPVAFIVFFIAFLKASFK